MRIAITMGDPAGIGPELILKCAASIARIGSCKIFGNTTIMEKTSRDIQLRRDFNSIKKYVVNCTKPLAFRYGNPTSTSGSVALASINAALHSGSDIIITPPIVKAVIQKRNPDFIGHTEYFAQYYGCSVCVKQCPFSKGADAYERLKSVVEGRD